MANVTQQQLDQLGSRFEKGLDEIKALIRSFEERVRHVEQQEAGCHPLVTIKLDAIEREIAEHKVKIEKMEDLVQKQIQIADNMSKDIATITGWGKWGARIATALIISGLTYFLGRLVYLSVAGA
jgi:uncharacterized protein YukE